MLADLVRAIDCFGKRAVTVALPTRRFRADINNRLAGRFFSLLAVRFVTLAPKNTKLKYTQEDSAHLFLPSSPDSSPVVSHCLIDMRGRVVIHHPLLHFSPPVDSRFLHRARDDWGRVSLVAYTSTAMPLDHSEVENNHQWRHSYITWHYLTFYISFGISSPCTKINSRTRLYNAAASPALRLRSAGSFAIKL